MNNDILQLDYFKLFDIAPDYSIDMKDLQQKLRQLQQKYHPDNVATDNQLNTQALQISSFINSAYGCLVDPLERAIYLLNLKGVNLNLTIETKFSHEFLIEQINLREQLDEAQENKDIDKLEQIEHNLKITYQQLEQQIKNKFDKQDYLNVIEDIKKLSFYSKLLKIVNDIFGEI